MSEVIKSYYAKTKLEEHQLNKKLEMINRHPDIKRELEDWIKNKQYKQNGICVEGFTAGSLAKISKYINGEAAFIMLIKLRENPDEAKRQIANGFKVK